MAFASCATMNHSLASSSLSQCLYGDLTANSAARIPLYASLSVNRRSMPVRRCRQTSVNKCVLARGAIASNEEVSVAGGASSSAGLDLKVGEEPAVKATRVRQGRSETRLLSMSALPLFLAATEVYWKPFETMTSTFTPAESSLKALYMVLSCAFCWGCVVFASMNDEFYDGDEYRNAGGNGTQYWMYEKEEEKEEEAREELWREELRREIEGRATEVKEIEGPAVEKEKELV